MGFRVAAWGWKHPAWQGSFYPEDLPPGWRFDYYANEFDAAVLPVGELDAAEQVDWEGEQATGFRLFLGVEADPGSASLPARPEWVLMVVSEPGSEERAVAHVRALAPRPVAVVHRGCPSSLLLAVADARVTVSWCEDGVPRWRGAGPLVLLWPHGLEPHPRSLRRMLEPLLALPGDQPVTLVFDGKSPDVDAMRRALTVAQLLGL